MPRTRPLPFASLPIHPPDLRLTFWLGMMPIPAAAIFVTTL
jgi:hypothetical protein